MNSYCLVIPVYNHHRQLLRIIDALRASELPLFIVNDGSDADCCAALARVAAQDADKQDADKHNPDEQDTDKKVRLINLPTNGGKGIAVVAGLRAAHREGFSHALQIDSDGQHDPVHIAEFLRAGDAHPDHVISGARPYHLLPASRRYGRRLTDFWVVINTLETRIQDSMCGYRLYPLGPTLKLVNEVDLCQRMDFDTDIAVQLLWRGVNITNVPISVVYDASIPSHFDLVNDNFRITAMHVRHFFGMLLRLPRLLRRKWT